MHDLVRLYAAWDRVARMDDDERCDFVKNNLALILTAAKARLSEGDPTAGSITIDAGNLPRPDGKATDRRKGDRRKGDRRKTTQPLGDKPERRRTDRRGGERRARPPKPTS